LGGSQDPGSEVAGRLLHEAGVAVVPGSAFSADTAEYIRISYASSYDNLEEAFRRIRRVY
jgi:aspartate/methionine/tyrosine aminotransferase